jgi:hypothetical protein
VPGCGVHAIVILGVYGIVRFPDVYTAHPPANPPAQEGKRMEPDSSLDLIIEDLPGIGRRYEMTGTNGGRIVVIINHSGRRVVHGLDPGADQASAVELTDRRGSSGRSWAGRSSSQRWWRSWRRCSATCSSTG